MPKLQTYPSTKIVEVSIIFNFADGNVQSICLYQHNASLILIDSTGPESFQLCSPTNWTNSQTPSVIANCTLNLLGINASMVQYAYSTNGSTSPSNWSLVSGIYSDLACTHAATTGTNGTIFIKVNAVPFNQDSDSLNTIRFQAKDYFR